MSIKVQTERTSKTWKLVKLVGFLGLAGGIAFTVINEGRESKIHGCLFALSGFGVLLFGRAGAWWFHE